MNIVDLYGRYIDDEKVALGCLQNDGELLRDFASIHNRIADLEVMIDVVSERPESKMLRYSLKEYHFSLFSASVANYRQSAMSIRLFMELSLGSIYKSAHEIYLRQWMVGQRDLNWSSIISSENGIFSVEFIRSFSSDLSDQGRQYLAIAEKLYRECSGYVHGNAFTHEKIEFSRIYCAENLRESLNRLDAAWTCLCFAYLCRYVSLMNADGKAKVRDNIIDSFGHLEVVREMFV